MTLKNNQINSSSSDSDRRHVSAINRRKKRNQRLAALILFIMVVSALSLYVAFTLERQQVWGMNIIVFIQAKRNLPLDLLVYLFSSMGFESFFLIIPLLTLSGRKRLQMIGLNLNSLLNFSLLLISVLKTVFVEPRPLWVNTEIAENQTGGRDYSFPSGHAFASTICWTYLTYCFPQFKWMPPISGTIILLTCFARVYFGVHYPHDVMTGIALGLITFVFQDFFSIYELPEHREEAREVNKHNKELEEEETFLLPRLGNNTSNNTKRRMIFHGIFLIFFLPLVLLILEREYMKRQMGLFYALGSILVTIPLSSHIVAFEDTKARKGKTFLRLFARVLVSLSPVATLVMLFKFFKLQETELVEIFLFMYGVIIHCFIHIFTPKICQFLKLGEVTGKIAKGKMK